MKSPNNSIVTGDSSTSSTSQKEVIDHPNHDDDMTSHAALPSKSQLTNEKPRGKWTHNPVVLSLIACSTMHNCEEVKEVYRDCIANNDTDSMLCEAAEKYYKMCHIDNGDANTILNFTPYVEP